MSGWILHTYAVKQSVFCFSSSMFSPAKHAESDIESLQTYANSIMRNVEILEGKVDKRPPLINCKGGPVRLNY